MPFVSDKQAAGLYNNANPLTAPGGALSVADNVTIYKQDEIEGRFPFERCSNGLPAAAPRQLFNFGGTLMTHIDNEIWYEYDTNCNFKKIPPPGIPVYLPRTFGMAPADADVIFMTEDATNYQKYHDLAKLTISSSLAQTYVGAIGNTRTRPTNAADGARLVAKLSFPTQVVCDNTYAYIADCGSGTIRKVDRLTGATTTIAGVINTFGNVDGLLGTNRLTAPNGLCLDTATSTLYFLDGKAPNGYPLSVGGCRFKKLDIGTGTVTTIAATVRATTDAYGSYSAFTTATSNYCYFSFINSGTINTGSTFLTVDSYAILRVNKTTGASTDFSGNWTTSGSAVGTAANTRFLNAKQICGDLTDTFLYVSQANRIIKIDVSTGTSSYAFGSGVAGLQPGNGVNCQISNPSALWIAGNTLWIGCASSSPGLGGIMYADLVTGDVSVYTTFSIDTTRADGFIIGDILEPAL
jgi:hypothetical protein